MKRRTFLTRTGAAVAGSLVLPQWTFGTPRSRPDKLNLALVGSGGWIARHAHGGGCGDENLVAFCDVDRRHCAENMKAWRTDQPFFDDFRVMFDEVGDQIDAVVVSTPDHCHFPATLAAMERGIHVYTQKPLAHDVWQVRTLEKARQRYGVMTQMGNQGHAGDGIRRSVEAVRAGVIGEVLEVHAWNGGPQLGGPHFANPTRMPPPSAAVPARLNWDLWLGPTRSREYSADYLPYTWRAFFDFGCGMLGDFGCHTLDTPVWALDLDAPTAVECEARAPSLLGHVPASSRLTFHFPAKGSRGPVKLYWYDGPQDFEKTGRIDKFGVGDITTAGRACWLVGSKGLLACGTHAGMPAIYPTEVREAWKAEPPKATIPRVEGGPFREWIRACKGEGPEPGSNFSYSSVLTEIILLGVLAQRFHTRIEWDAERGQITNQPELNAFIKEPVREGWQFGESLWS
ncbi:MAG: Gfo/Idh/MocA family oxidoreductase [Planctomycetota bacterium]